MKALPAWLEALVTLLLATCWTQAALPPRPFAHPERIRYDGHCLTIDGQDVLIYSGAFHYFRCPKPLWRARFAKMKAAGLNAVETYVAWNVHEPAYLAWTKHWYRAVRTLEGPGPDAAVVWP